ncbi:DUF937 domain-containing protein [Dysgonomonas sp. 521]|uniref:DUF937 domain-containing protein n=1 Tax=Dysgonomonas sp. 521 TaxID=2302932 RepID=UPI0013D12A2C|nr:DUF937 domain-containing protein [Dysgonomonas sp. 521]NDV95337.1 DUF937 domain-containing protein [Dysgonomonas sp. 521]
MLDGILDLIKDQALGAVTQAGVPADKQSAAVETTASSIVDGLKDQLSLDNVSSLMSLFGGSSSSSSALSASNPIVSSIQKTVVTSLSEKVGLNSAMANTIASTVVPALIGLLSKKSSDPNDSFDFGSLLKSFTGGGDSAGGLLGGLLGKFLK